MSYFLFSIDLEEVFFRLEPQEKVENRVPVVMKELLLFLKRAGVHITFFTVGDIAENYPEVIKKIVEDGHEIACHSNRHITLDKQTPEEFETDLIQNIQLLKAAGAKSITGYRAPNFSINESRTWVYGILAKHGIKYSSSVLPAKNPLFGWETFGQEAKKIEGVQELPISLAPLLTKKLPFGGGIYFRVLPFMWIRRQFKKHIKRGKAVLGYMHPYDFDYTQPRIMHPGINKSKLFNTLMYYNRKGLYKRLAKLISKYQVITYQQYVDKTYGIQH